ncbi:3-hydroxybutyryl-CoA dehydrogenase [Bacillus sp. Marseille-P3661]|uniref:3-hydroxybutyryl-CoA dehydrogenase n=1 Tax=Bacillus sp. Marseille-P3661 TaxID=1936234 RepID=UPI000C8631DD|nr:3-hydroxybutyryl-CoA dehydrogenase [Bacillus sp. Marseille-P3661]
MSSEKIKIAVVGAGRMGRGIAHVFAYAGYEVNLVDIKSRSEDEKERVLLEALAEIKGNIMFLSSIGMIEESHIQTILNRIRVYGSNQFNQAVQGANVVFEAVPEILNVKQEAFSKICKVVSSDTVIASTTSSFLVNELAGFVDQSERFLNTHWLNPAYLIPLVEVSPSDFTRKEVVKSVTDLLDSIGKVPVVCAASPGFIVPRLQALTMNEAARLVEEGVATVEDVDKASKAGFGIRFAVLGLLEFIDWGGGDILYYASNYLKDSLKADRYTPPEIIASNMENGNIGMKTGKGFYEFPKEGLSDYQKETIHKFVDLLQHLGYLKPPVGEKIEIIE